MVDQRSITLLAAAEDAGFEVQADGRLVGTMQALRRLAEVIEERVRRADIERRIDGGESHE